MSSGLFFGDRHFSAPGFRVKPTGPLSEEQPGTGMVLEYWGDGVMETERRGAQYSNTPALHHSNAPLQGCSSLIAIRLTPPRRADENAAKLQ
jgi:hypothetical protein